MVMPLQVRDAVGKEYGGPYLLYITGWTEERFFEEASESWFMEFVDGELIVHSPASSRHQDIAVFLTTLLRTYVDAQGLGKVLAGPAVVRLRPDLDYEPDLFFISKDQLSNLEEQRFSGAPRFIIEVLSESTRNHDLRTKASSYHEHGVDEYWVVDYANQRLVRHLLPEGSGQAYQIEQVTAGRLESRAVPGFWLDISWLWADPLPGSFDCLRKILNL